MEEQCKSYFTILSEEQCKSYFTNIVPAREVKEPELMAWVTRVAELRGSSKVKQERHNLVRVILDAEVLSSAEIASLSAQELRDMGMAFGPAKMIAGFLGDAEGIKTPAQPSLAEDPSLQVAVSHTEEKEGHTWFVLQVAVEHANWEVWVRYSDVRDLHKELTKKGIELPKLPRKHSAFSNKKDKTIQEREEGFNQIFAALIDERLCGYPAVSEMLDFERGETLVRTHREGLAEEEETRQRSRDYHQQLARQREEQQQQAAKQWVQQRQGTMQQRVQSAPFTNRSYDAKPLDGGAYQPSPRDSAPSRSVAQQQSSNPFEAMQKRQSPPSPATSPQSLALPTSRRDPPAAKRPLQREEIRPSPGSPNSPDPVAVNTPDLWYDLDGVWDTESGLRLEVSGHRVDYLDLPPEAATTFSAHQTLDVDGEEYKIVDIELGEDSLISRVRWSDADVWYRSGFKSAGALASEIAAVCVAKGPSGSAGDGAGNGCCNACILA